MASESPTPIKLDRAIVSDVVKQDDRAASNADAKQAARLERSADLLRSELTEEIIAMIHYGSSNGRRRRGGAGGQRGLRSACGRSASCPRSPMLLAAHHSLKVLIAPATPAGVRVYCQMRGGRARLLGPHATIRRLSLANLVFMLLFFATSVSALINAETIQLSVYEQSGAPLLFKLLFITAVSGIGASFAVLFEAWEDVRRRRFDPVMESSYWLQIGLGVVAGIILTEIVQTGAPGRGHVQHQGAARRPRGRLLGGAASRGAVPRGEGDQEHLRAGRAEVAGKSASAVAFRRPR